MRHQESAVHVAGTSGHNDAPPEGNETNRASVFSGKSILVTGGCGSLGSHIAKALLLADARRIAICDINQAAMGPLERKLNDKRLRFFVGDVRDRDRTRRAVEDCDIVFHCAALKIIPSCEYNPTEAIRTNIIGTQNLLEACLDEEPERVFAISTDKACAPLNLYGATKLCMERLIVAANLMKGKRRTVFSCVRYGNVWGSNESVIPVWVEQLAAGREITVTSPKMTRFSITMDQAIDFIFRCLAKASGGEVFIPKLRAYYIGDLVSALRELSRVHLDVREIGLRPGEKEHETLISDHEARLAYDIGAEYVILPDPDTRQRYDLKYDFAQMTPLGNSADIPYSSANAEKMTVEELKELLTKERLLETMSEI
jgi:FlaA1/EpsC-like NDP-sugar epimerase